MTEVWLAIGILAVVSFAIRATGPVILGGRELRASAGRLVALLPVAVLSALIAVQTFADGRELVLDARAAGLGAALVAIALRSHVAVVLVAAALATAAVRALA